MVIHILFTTSQHTMSHLIRWATGEDCSHVAIGYRSISGDPWVFHSNWKGSHCDSLEDFEKENTIVHSVAVETTEDKLFQFIEKERSHMYDLGALLFCGLVLLARRILCRIGFTLAHSWPKVNLWQSTGMYMCTELVTRFVYNRVDSLITPYKLYMQLTNKKE